MQIKRVSDYITHLDKLHVTLPSLVGYKRQMRVSLLTVFADYFTVITLILPQESIKLQESTTGPGANRLSTQHV